jgi:hypothetical protein
MSRAFLLLLALLPGCRKQFNWPTDSGIPDMVSSCITTASAIDCTSICNKLDTTLATCNIEGLDCMTDCASGKATGGTALIGLGCTMLATTCTELSACRTRCEPKVGDPCDPLRVLSMGCGVKQDCDGATRKCVAEKMCSDESVCGGYQCSTTCFTNCGDGSGGTLPTCSTGYRCDTATGACVSTAGDAGADM